MCFDRNINENRDVKFLGCDYLLVQRWVKLTLVSNLWIWKIKARPWLVWPVPSPLQYKNEMKLVIPIWSCIWIRFKEFLKSMLKFQIKFIFFLFTYFQQILQGFNTIYLSNWINVFTYHLNISKTAFSQEISKVCILLSVLLHSKV